MLSWNVRAARAAYAACLTPLANPLHESRMYAVMHIAVHDALNAIDRRSRPYAFDAEVTANTSPDAAVAAAARDVLVPLIAQLPLEINSQSCIDAGVASVQAPYAAALAAIPDGPAKAQGIAVGSGRGCRYPWIEGQRRRRRAIPQLRLPAEHRARGVSMHAGYAVHRLREMAGRYAVRPEAQLSVPPGTAVPSDSKKYTEDFNEVKSLGSAAPSGRSTEETEIALFWWESSPLKWNRIARTVSADQRLNLWENARLFGLLNMALADGYVAMVDSKNHYNYWRPITAIRNGDTDGNPDTVGDPTWTPFQGTPPNQDYVSGHAIEGGAGAEVLRQFFGTDDISFRDCSASLPAGSTCDDAAPVFRRYASFSQAAAENAYSRILIGFHFRKSVEAGTRYGKMIGKRAVAALN